MLCFPSSKCIQHQHKSTITVRRMQTKPTDAGRAAHLHGRWRLLLPNGSLLLGFDCSTQSLEANLTIVAHGAVHFGSDLPHYGTKSGVRRDPAGPGRIVSPPLMWAEALELLLHRLRLRPRVDYASVVAVSGSVCWSEGAGAALASLDPAKNLAPQLATPESPVWMDCSTTGHRAHERCTGPQVRKMYQTKLRVYDTNERISLVSSFMASVLIGGYACIDETDGAGMNLMDIVTRQLRKDALEATAPNLEEKIGKLVPVHAVAGTIAPYFVQRFQFTSDCLVVRSGDNPSSLAGSKALPVFCVYSYAGLTLSNPGDLGISLGTSDTIFGITDAPEPSVDGNILPNSVDPKTYMPMLCYKNGALTQKRRRIGILLQGT